MAAARDQKRHVKIGESSEKSETPRKIIYFLNSERQVTALSAHVYKEEIAIQVKKAKMLDIKR